MYKIYAVNSFDYKIFHIANTKDIYSFVEIFTTNDKDTLIQIIARIDELYNGGIDLMIDSYSFLQYLV